MKKSPAGAAKRRRGRAAANSGTPPAPAAAQAPTAAATLRVANSNTYSLSDAIFWGELVQQAYDMTDAAGGALTPPPPASPGIPQGWSLAYYLSVTDQVLFIEETSMFGYVLTSGNQWGIVVRGTEGTLEWIEDAEAVLTSCQFGATNFGNVEAGFSSVFGDISVRRPDGLEIGKLPQWLATLPSTAQATVAGHSLGGAVATLAAAQLASQGLQTWAYTFASPRVGDIHFATAFNGLAALSNYRIYNIHDVVPDLPGKDLGYEDVAVGIAIDSTDLPQVRTNIGCFHSLRTYLAVLGSKIYGPSPDCLAGAAGSGG